MAEHLRKPPNAQTRNASQQSLSTKVSDVAQDGMRPQQGEVQKRNASMVTLGTGNPQPFAQAGMHPQQNEIQKRNASLANVSRKASMPYGYNNKTDSPIDY